MDVPDDIQKAAERLFSDWGFPITERDERDIVPSIARALLAQGKAATERAAKIAESVGNFGDYRRDELTKDFGQPRYDMMVAIAAAIRQP